MIVSCSATGKKEVNENASKEAITELSENSGGGKPITMTKAMFLKQVYNYEKNPQTWKYEGKLPCIIDFYADWCGPCKRIAPIIGKLAKEYDGKIIFYKINTDKERELTVAFGIQSIPSILFCPANSKPQMNQGALSEETFRQIINEVIFAETLPVK
jgi:thioredoxin